MEGKRRRGPRGGGGIRKLTPQTREAMVGRVRAGEDPMVLALEYGVSAGYIRSWYAPSPTDTLWYQVDLTRHAKLDTSELDKDRHQDSKPSPQGEGA